MSRDESDIESYPEQERDSAEIKALGLMMKLLSQVGDKAMKNRSERTSEREKLRKANIAPKDVKLWNPLLSEVRGEHDLLNADLEILARNGFVHVHDLISIPKDQLQQVHETMAKAGLSKEITFQEFKETISDLKAAFPKAHYFLAQPVKENFVGRPDGGRDGSGMMF